MQLPGALRAFICQPSDEKSYDCQRKRDLQPPRHGYRGECPGPSFSPFWILVFDNVRTKERLHIQRE
jgi:hypothetical protein